jgi:subtilase family serine protease
VNGPYTPSDLRRAYKLVGASLHRGRRRTVAIVDAFNNPRAVANLNTYRAQFHLPPCTTSNHCLRIVNQNGKAHPLPANRQSWGVEIALDLDMVSAICPNCHILLVEAKNPRFGNMGAAVNTAVRMGAKYVSNSWGAGEFRGQNQFSHFFNHPGRVINFASGDLGFGPTFPASLQYVTSIGGTHLVHQAGGRGWAESVWRTSASEVMAARRPQSLPEQDPERRRRGRRSGNRRGRPRHIRCSRLDRSGRHQRVDADHHRHLRARRHA